MKKINFIKLSLGLCALAMLANCSARNISKEANANLDPMPLMDPSKNVQPGPDPMTAKQWNLTKVLPTAMTAGSGSRRVMVAVLGTGVDYTHEDLAMNIFINRSELKSITPGANDSRDDKDDDTNGYNDDFAGYDFVENDGLPFDRNGAGTAMAGVLGAVSNNSKGIRGVVENLSMLPVRFIDESGHMLIPNFYKAIAYAVAMKADIILLHTPSYEFGSTERRAEARQRLATLELQMFKQSMSAAEKAGILVVASAGNTGNGITSASSQKSIINALGEFTNVVIVTSTDKDDKRPFIANYGRERIHTAAPGKDILTTAPGNQYKLVSSSSLAAAHVAGALALAIDKQFGRSEPRKLIEAFIKPDAGDLVEGLKFETIGGNRLNVSKYLNFVSSN